MSIFKCKMCGGTIEFAPSATVGVCDSCGTKQTLPRLDDDRRANLYDRANHFRRNNDFDKAAAIYEQILNEDTTDAEAYWSLVLCQYGIEYVEDPATHKRIPTVNRAQFTSIFDDDNYKSAIQYADSYQRSLYEEEAAAINEIQKGILAISQKEEPFDVFICYKETDNNGRRTPDSVLANDLYHQLTQEGFKVFFSRITLEDKLGTAYEPYIFAALNSSKVMVVLGTKPEHFNAVWVKNEWSRYLALVKKSGGKKILIPAYRDMDPYDLPEEFSHLQAQDMSKLGFMQDLIRGIKKIVGAEEPKAAQRETVVVNSGNTNAATLLRRAFMFLEDGEWNKADDFCEQVLNLDPENAQAYLGKLMAEYHVHRLEDFPNCEKPFDKSNNFKKVIRFGGDKLSTTLKKCISHINERNENARITGIYDGAVKAMNSAGTEADYIAAAETFKTIPGFKDADSLAEQCLDKAEICRKDAVYTSARSQMNIENYGSAIKTLQTISGWKDADEQIQACQRKIEEIKAKEEADRLVAARREEERRIAAEKAAKKRKKIIAITTPIVVGCIAFVVLLITVIIPKQKLNKAMGLLESGDYEAAYALLEEIGNSDAIVSNKIDRAISLINSEDDEGAYALLAEIGNSDASASSRYDRAVSLIDSGDYKSAYILLNGLNYKDSSDQLVRIKKILLSKADVGSYVFFGSYEQDNNTSNGNEDIEWLVLAKEDNKLLVTSRYALDCQKFDAYHWGKWGDCSLRTWLNDTFINSTFSSEEKAMIPIVTLSDDNNPDHSTQDQIFLLSIPEANKYFSSDEARMCAPTDYAIAQGAVTNDNYSVDGKAAGWWWLRSPGIYSGGAAIVNSNGSVNDGGNGVDCGSNGVRPALWINLGF